MVGALMDQHLFSPMDEYVNDLKIEIATLKMVNKALLSALSDFMYCPYDIDTATIPEAGIETNPEQVIGNMSVALVKIRAARAALELHDKEFPYKDNQSWSL